MFKKLAALIALSAPAIAFAAVDVTEVVTEIEGAVAPITLVATAVLTVLVAIKVFHYVRRSM